MAKTKKKIDVVSATVGKDQIDMLTAGFNMNDKEIYFVVGEDTISIMVRPHISLAERSLMIEEIADFCFVEDMYVPYMADFARVVSVLNHYTNIDIASIEMEQAYHLTKNRDMYRVIYDAIEDDLSSVFADANILIDWRKQQLMKSTKADELYDTAIKFLIGLESALDKIADNMDVDSATGLNDLIVAASKIRKMDETDMAHAVLDIQGTKKKQASKKTAAKKKVSPAIEKE